MQQTEAGETHQLNTQTEKKKKEAAHLQNHETEKRKRHERAFTLHSSDVDMIHSDDTSQSDCNVICIVCFNIWRL